MAEPYLGEIRMFGGNYAPTGWALCNGQILNISEHDALFTLLGTTYGGNGQTTFALPDLRGRVPIHKGSNQGYNYPLGSQAGTETVTLLQNQLPAHTHLALSTDAAGSASSPSNALWSAATTTNFGASQGNALVPMNAQSITHTGGTQPHNNMMPSMTISFIIALYGIYPISQ